MLCAILKGIFSMLAGAWRILGREARREVSRKHLGVPDAFLNIWHTDTDTLHWHRTRSWGQSSPALCFSSTTTATPSAVAAALSAMTATVLAIAGHVRRLSPSCSSINWPVAYAPASAATTSSESAPTPPARCPAEVAPQPRWPRRRVSPPLASSQTTRDEQLGPPNTR